MSNPQVANTIISQMGGLGKLQAMVGAHRMSYSDNGFTFWFKGSRKHNICSVTLDPDDTYTFKLMRYTNSKGLITNCELDGVYWDMLKPLFEEETGLYLSL